MYIYTASPNIQIFAFQNLKLMNIFNLWICGTEHSSALLHRVQSLPHHRHHRSRSHVANKLAEEPLLRQVGVVFPQQRVVSLHKLSGQQLEAARFESVHDGAHKTAVHGVRLQHDEGSFAIGGISVFALYVILIYQTLIMGD